MTPRVAICVGHRPRDEHDVRVWSWVEARWRTLFPHWLVYVADSGHERYNRSASHNAAARLAGDVDVLVFANSDTTVLNVRELEASVILASQGQWVLSNLYVETSTAYTETVLQGLPWADLPDPLSSYDRQLPDSCAGPQVVSAEQFWDVGGLDERYTGWGWADRSLMDALDVLHRPHVRIGTTVHLYHDRGPAEDPAQNGAMRRIWATQYKRAARQGPTAMRHLIENRDNLR